MRRLKRMNLWWPGEKMGQRDSQGAWDGHVHTAIFKMGNQQGPKVWNLAHGTQLSVMCQPGWEGVWERMDMCIGLAESLHCSPEAVTTLSIGYTPV